jgi:CRISPR-associated endonuclease/helicase Cas3
MSEALAHTDGAGENGHYLVDHLRDVASRARGFAEAAKPLDHDFAALAEWAGWLHDLGKYRVEFQEYLLGRRPGGRETQHAVFGAAQSRRLNVPWAVAFSILGHHAGLPSFSHGKDQIWDSTLEPLRVSEALGRSLDADRNDASWPDTVCEFLKDRRGLEATFDQELLIRMLFSCLVDADYLDTEAYMTGQERVPAPILGKRFFESLDEYALELAQGSESTTVNTLRREIYQACLDAADRPPGCFRITAPTGSGKTLAMLAFALKHAEKKNLRRVIVVLPFLAIIEQNARVYRDALQSLDESGVLIEHHSAVMVSGDDGSEQTENESQHQIRAKQATENWDAPVIVTTAVQFLESLFARRPAACRKLHNIARSVVVFDEVQTLPFPLLDPILSAIRTLRDTFGVSFLFGSATQPHLQRSPNLSSGFAVDGSECHEIVNDLGRTFDIFRRTTLELPCLTEPPWTWDDLITRLETEPQALIIVNLRKHAQDLFDRLRVARTPGLFHLSSTMCAAHRTDKLGRKDHPEPGTIYHALKSGGPCVVVSTQVVEAGVDLDFPIVFRAIGPLDSIIQAAGRCDREGKRTLAAGRPGGRVVVFTPAAKPSVPPGFYEEATTLSLRFLEEHAADPQRILHDPSLFAEYHNALIASGNGRKRSEAVQAARKILDFKEVASLFRIIDETGQGVVVQYGESNDRLEEIRHRQYIKPGDWRFLQRFTVNLYPTWISKLQSQLRPIINREGAPLEYVGNYDEKDIGLRLGELPPEQFVV